MEKRKKIGKKEKKWKNGKKLEKWKKIGKFIEKLIIFENKNKNINKKKKVKYILYLT